MVRPLSHLLSLSRLQSTRLHHDNMMCALLPQPLIAERAETISLDMNGPGALRTWGGELFAIFSLEPIVGGHLTVDARAPLEGRLFNLGVRYAL